MGTPQCPPPAVPAPAPPEAAAAAEAAMRRSSTESRLSASARSRPGSLTLESNEASDATHDHDHETGAAQEEKAAEAPHSVFSRSEIRLIVLIASICGFISPLTNNAPLASLPDMARDLGVTIEAATLSVTLAMIGQGISPLFFGSYTDILGRRPIYILCLIIYAGANAGLANLPHSYGGLLALRLVQAAGSASMISVGAGTIGDVTTPRTRGGYMGIFQAGAALGPCVGPIVGGLLTQAYGWRSVMWFCFIIGVLGLVLVLLFQPETLRRLVGNGSLPPPTIVHDAGWKLLCGTTASQLTGQPRPGWPADPNPPASTWRHFMRGLSRPLGPASLLLLPEVALLLFATALPFMGWTCVTSTISSLFVEQYGLSTSEAGLIFLAPGVGTVLTGVFFGRLLDADYRRAKHAIEAARQERSAEQDCEAQPGAATGKEAAASPHAGVSRSEVPLESVRLKRYPILLAVVTSTLVAYGWTVSRRVHLAVPCILLFVNAMASGATMSICQVLLVDWLPGRGASVTAANNLVRCLLGAGGTAAVQPVIARIGIGWTFTVVAGVCVSAAPLAWLVWHSGERWRHARAAKHPEGADSP